MSILQALLDKLQSLVPTAVAVFAVIVVLGGVRTILGRQWGSRPGNAFRLHIILLVLSLFGLVVIVMALPVSDATIGQLLSLIGLLLSAALALSSTTFLGNVLAGLMLRAVRNFRPGDYIRVEEQFGRVSERGLFHVEIQTEDRDLTTLPNLYLVTHPVKVVRSSGTLVTAEVSLGYDVPRGRVKERLLEAAGDAQLEDPFVQVLNLGDFSVTYRVAGLLTHVKTLISTRSRLREAMLDRLHGDGIEIVSPTFMNQRRLSQDRKIVPRVSSSDDRSLAETLQPESLIFDKANEAESLARLEHRLEEMDAELKIQKETLGQTTDDDTRGRLKKQIESLESRRDLLIELIKRRQSEA